MAKSALKAKASPEKHINYRSIISWVVLTFAAVFLLLAQGSAWVKNTVFNQSEFRSIAVTTILQQQNRDAIASRVVDVALQDRPVVKRLVGDRVTAFTSGLLASDFGERVLNGVTKKLYEYVTNPRPKNIELQLTVIKEPLSILTSVAQNLGTKVDVQPSSIPDTVVLVNAKEVPNISGVYRSFIWLAPLFWLLTAISFAIYIYMNRTDYARHVYRAYMAIVVVGIIGLSMGPFVPQSVGTFVADANTSSVVTNLVAAFLEPFSAQMWTMLIIATVAVVIFSQRRRISRGTQLLLAKATQPKAKV